MFGQTHEGSSDRSFGLVMAGAFCIFAAINLWRGGLMWVWLLAAAAMFAIAALAAPAVLHPLNVAWHRIGLVLHKISSPIIMGLLFFLVITPIGLLMRALGKDMLRLRVDREAQSYWIRRDPPGPSGASMKEQF